MGVDLAAVPTTGTGAALTVATEIGPDFSAWPFVQSSTYARGWAVPGTRISGGRTPPDRAFSPIGQAPHVAVVGTRRNQFFVEAQRCPHLSHMDVAGAVTSPAGDLACLTYSMMTREAGLP